MDTALDVAQLALILLALLLEKAVLLIQAFGDRCLGHRQVLVRFCSVALNSGIDLLNDIFKPRRHISLPCLDIEGYLVHLLL